MGKAAASASQKVPVYGLFPLSFISLTAPFSSSKQPFSAQSGSSQAEKIHDRHVWQCLCLLPFPPPPLRGVGLGSVVGAGLIREGVGPCVGWCEGDSVGYVGGVEQVHRQVPLPAAPPPCIAAPRPPGTRPAPAPSFSRRRTWLPSTRRARSDARLRGGRRVHRRRLGAQVRRRRRHRRGG